MAEVRAKPSDFKRQGKTPEKPPAKRVNRHVKRQPRPPQRPVEPPEEEEEDEEESVPETEIVNSPDISTWPTRTQAARRIGVDKRTIMRWQKDGDIEGVVDSQGFYRFNPEDVDEMAASRTGDAAQMMGQSVAMVVTSSTELTRHSQQHAQAFADAHLKQSDIAFSQMQAMTDQIIQENVSLRAYIRELEGDRKQAVKEVEEAKGKVHERQLLELEVTTREKRIDWAMGTFLQLAGPGIAQKLGIPIGSIPPLPGMTPIGSSTPTPSTTSASPGVTPPSADGAKTTEVNGTGPLKISDPPTVQNLVDLETNTLLLIGNIEEERLKMLCQFSKPHEAEALMQIWKMIDKMRTAAKEAAAKAEGEKKA